MTAYGILPRTLEEDLLKATFIKAVAAFAVPTVCWQLSNKACAMNARNKKNFFVKVSGNGCIAQGRIGARSIIKFYKGKSCFRKPRLSRKKKRM
jgi:hypothetical protein